MGNRAWPDSSRREVGVLGFRVQVTPATRIVGAPPRFPGYPELALEDLSADDILSASGTLLGDVVVADIISVDDLGGHVGSENFALDQPFIRFGSHSFRTDDSTLIDVNHCYDYSETISPDDFFSNDWSAPGTVVGLRFDVDADPLVVRNIDVFDPICDY